QDLIIKLKGVDDRDAANLLTNCEIVVDSSQLPALEEGDYYWKALYNRVKTDYPGFVSCYLLRPLYSSDGSVILAEAGAELTGEQT
ncbi:hypothetical protein ONJ45_25500, partial [Salmonella enterica subsp. enterica serovar Virginia]|nr:hypothetical protein [Salmonella enterica subsp. enterica serovar Virginia]